MVLEELRVWEWRVVSVRAFERYFGRERHLRHIFARLIDNGISIRFAVDRIKAEVETAKGFMDDRSECEEVLGTIDVCAFERRCQR